MRILIAEDETVVREVLVEYLRAMMPEVAITEAKDGNDALAKATKASFDVVFLDIEMPGLDGMEVASRLLALKEPPRVVFATGQAGHALEAFELAAFDYILKPFDPERLEQTVKRLMEDNDHSRRQRESFGRLFDHPNSARVWAEASEDNWVLLDHQEVHWIEASGRSVTLHTPGHPPLKVKQTLKEIESRFEPHGFVRVHKAYLVNTSKVSSMKAWFSGSFVLIMDDGEQTEIPLSRRYAAEFKRITGWT